MTSTVWWQSKMFWLNAVTVALGLLALPDVIAVIPTKYLPLIATINAIGNFILRQTSQTPITLTKEGAAVNNQNALKSIAAIIAIPLIGLALLGNAACTQNARHVATVADTAVYTGLAAFQDGENALYQAGKLDADPAVNKKKHQDVNKVLVKALTSGAAMNRVIRGWQPGTPQPPELQQHVKDLRELSQLIVDSFVDGPVKSQLSGWLLTAQTAALAVIANLPQ